MKRLCGIGLAAAVCLGVAAPHPAAAQKLIIAVEAPFFLDPHFLFSGPDMAAARTIFDSLINRDDESNFIPGIVQSWSTIDPQTWELKLRPGVTFQNGAKFTADDVAYSIARVPAVPNNPGPYTSNLRTIIRVEVVDPLTVRLHTDRPNPALLGQLTDIFVVSRATTEGASTADFNSGKAAIGTGPYRVVQSRGSEGMTIARNDSYWGEKPAYGDVDVRVIGNDAAREAGLLSGDIDLIEAVPPTDVAKLEGDSRVSVFRRNSDRIMYLLPNVGPEKLALLTDSNGQPLATNPFRDVRVRRALSLAIDRNALVSRALDGMAVATMQMVPEQFGSYDPSLKIPPADPAGAKKLLAEAGYPNGFGFTLGCSNNRFVNDARVCQAAGQMFARAGFQVKVETQPWNVFSPRTLEGKNDLPLMLYGLSLSTSRDAAYILSTAVHTRNVKEAFGQGNRGVFSDKRLDGLIDAAIIRMDDKREEGLQQAMLESLDQVPFVPLYNQTTVVAARKGIVYKPRMDEQIVPQNASPVAPGSATQGAAK